MASYEFLKSVLVIELAQLGMDTLGGHLADMGARVVKVEALPHGDPVRRTGELAIGTDSGVGFMHLRWNRGKQSIGLDLRDERGAALFRELVGRADVLIEGLKGGALARMGLGHETLRAANPALVHCSLSGLGLDGPYHALRSHAVAYDAYAGHVPQDTGTPPPACGDYRAPSIGMVAPGLFGAVGVLSALLHARETGEGAFLEIAAADVAAMWMPDSIDAEVNAQVARPRAGFADETGRMRNWPRLCPYETRDGRVLLLEAYAEPTWIKFCNLVGREDLLASQPRPGEGAAFHAAMQAELAAILRQRTLAEWMADFLAHDISAMPLNDMASLARDPHFQARSNWYDVDVPSAGTLRLSGTPIRVRGAAFAPTLAPDLGADSDAILADLLDLAPGTVAALKDAGVVG